MFYKYMYENVILIVTRKPVVKTLCVLLQVLELMIYISVVISVLGALMALAVM
jgi:hypothetical protein